MSYWKLHFYKNKVRWYQGEVYDEERDNYEWEDTISYNGYGRGRSSCVIYFWSVKHQQDMIMFMTDFNDIVNKLDYGKLSGTFTFCKRGENYGIKIVKKC